MNRGVVAGALATVGGLVLAGAAVGRWTVVIFHSDVGGVPIEELGGTAGVELAPAALPIGVAGLFVGLGLLVISGRVQTVLGLMAAAIGGAGQVTVVIGTMRAIDEPGALAVAPFLGFVGAFAVTMAGFVGLRPSRAPRLPSRYELESDDEDREWRLASDEAGDEPDR